MKPYEKGDWVLGTGKPSDHLRIGVTFKGQHSQVGPVSAAAPMSAASVKSFVPDPYQMDMALHEFHLRGFKVTARGHLTASVRGTPELFEKTFGTKLSIVRLDTRKPYQFHDFYFPAEDAPWKPDPVLADLIDDAYIQWPHVCMAKNSTVAKPPRKARRSAPATMGGAVVGGTISAMPTNVPYWHLEPPNGLTNLLNVIPIHRTGSMGAGVRIAMIDTGFYHEHPFFAAHHYTSSIVTAAGASGRSTDESGHGTGESANIFAIAPEATFIGIKLGSDDPSQPGASILEGFQEALQHQPQVISVSMGYDLRDDANAPLGQLPNNLKALEAEIQAAIARGIVVVFSAGNGHYSFPGQMPEVISAGGVYVDQAGDRQASDYASAFTSRIYSGRNVPDFSGLVGLLPNADYISLPVPPGGQLDVENSAHDGTPPNDGWGVFSGTSAAAPQIAGVCALLLAKNPGLQPAEIKAILKRTARDVTTGHANPASDPNQVGVSAADGAAGTGLVDAFAAWQQA